MKRTVSCGMAVLLAVSACTSDPADPAPKTVPTRPSTYRPAPPLAIADTPLWTVRTAPDAKAYGALDAGTLMVYEETNRLGTDGRDFVSFDTLSAYDAATGKRRWILRDRTELIGGGGATWEPGIHPAEPRVVELSRGPAVVVDYARDGVDRVEYGVAALSVVDGRVLWQVPMATPVDGDESRFVSSVADANGELALVSVFPDTPDVDGAQRTVALDMTTGKRVWQQRGFWPLRISGDTVIGQVSDKPPERLPDTQQLIGVDAATGERRWDLAERYQSSSLVAAAGDVAVVQVTPDLRTVALDLRSGKELMELRFVGTNCTSDGESVVACIQTGPDPARLATLRSGSREKSVSDHEPTGAPVHAWRDYVFLDNGQLIDHAANVLADGLPHEVLAVSEQYAAFAENGTVAVHRIG